MDHKDFYKTVAIEVAEACRVGYAPWLNDLKPGQRELPHNPMNGQMFNNVNGQYLDLVAARNAWDDPRWVSTGDIANTQGLSLRYGEKPTFIARQNRYVHPTLGETTSTEYIPMYNAAQVKGLPPYEHGRVTSFTDARRNCFEENTDMSYRTAQELTKLYFKEQEQRHGLDNASIIEPIARYYLSLATTTEYTAPEHKAAVVAALSHPKNPEDNLRALYNANVYTNKITNPGFSYERDDARRTAARDSDRLIQPRSREHSYGR